MNKSYNKLKNINIEIINKLTDLSISEIYTICFLYYNLDLTLFKNPILEYLNLKKYANLYLYNCKQSYLKTLDFNLIDGYTFLDPELEFLKNKSANIFKADSNFNLNYPTVFYSKNILSKIYYNYTNLTTSNNDLHFELSNYTLLQNFYHGFQKNICNTETPIYLETVSELNNSEIICFGVLYSKLYAFTYTELIDSFNNNYNFKLTDNIEPDSECINKLHEYCVKSTNLILKNLELAINNVKMYQSSKGIKMLQFYNYYKNSENKKLILQILTQILYFGMYMRGWDGKSEFPIKIALADDLDFVNTNVSNSLIKLEEYLYTLKSDAIYIKDFPLLKYNNGFYFTNNKSDGLTLWDRIEIIKLGDTTVNMNSCIRLSSNLICSTVYKMYITLKLNPPFEINELRNIS